MEEDKIKDAFFKVKRDIELLSQEMIQLRHEIGGIKQFLEDFSSSTLRQISSTYPATPTDNPTHPQEIGGLKTLNLSISTGNEGVPTDRQTDRQTDNPTHFQVEKTLESDLQKATNILDSLDSLKKQIRRKFKHLTNQEMLVFSTVYQLEEQDPSLATYKEIALKLGLSESSIRDYVQRIANKGISIQKNKINNKKVLLSISPDLKRIATLSTIIQLREL